MFGSPETTTGGRALKFYASVRLDIRRIETLKDGTEAFGNRVRVKVVKNKVAPPFRQAEFDIVYGDGISWEGTVLDVALEKKVISKSGSFFSFGEERLGQGRERVKAFLREHPDTLQAILNGIQEASEGVVIPGATVPPPGSTTEEAVGDEPAASLSTNGAAAH
jgi:recombination protein RecA